MRTGKSISICRPISGGSTLSSKIATLRRSTSGGLEIVLFTADGVGTNEIMRRTGKTKTCVWRWQERFVEEGYEGLLRDKTRPSRIPPLGAEVAERVVALTLGDPPARRPIGPAP